MSRRHESSSIVTRLSPVTAERVVDEHVDAAGERALDVGGDGDVGDHGLGPAAGSRRGGVRAPGVDVDAAHARALGGEAAHERAADAAAATRDRYRLALEAHAGILSRG